MAKKPITDEERLTLAKKLDKELDVFINNLPKKKVTELEPFENILEDLPNHPFFLKEVPKPGDKLHPLYEGLQNLKYDPDENTPDELVQSYKEDGNFNFKHKNYRLAILSYTEGLKSKCDKPDLLGNLLNNRSACHWFLKNYRSCLKDCESALKLMPNYDKVIIRAAKASYELKDFEKCIHYCDILLNKSADLVEILELRKRSVAAGKEKDRDRRKQEKLLKKQEIEEEQLLNKILERGITIEGGKRLLTLTKLEPCIPELVHHRVYINEKNELVWPAIFLYPEYQTMDFIQEFNENDFLLDHLNKVLEYLPNWDKNKEYKADNINVYFENKLKNRIYKIDPIVGISLVDILKNINFLLVGGTPSFIILVKDSRVETNFVQKYN